MHIILIDLRNDESLQMSEGGAVGEKKNIFVPDAIKLKLTSDLWVRSQIAATQRCRCDEIIKLQRAARGEQMCGIA